jgi:prepilin-type N-terminal cleavage/methylation domain-containing protein
MHRTRFVRRAFTLVELLVVIAIIGVLVAILLPAIQAAREAARRTQCIDNLKNIGLAFNNHLDAHKHLPTGGWGWLWAGDADRGYGPRQPGGWIYNILPYMEEQALHDLGKGLAEAAKRPLHRQRTQTPLAWLTCPTRRAVDVFPVTWSGIATNPGINIAPPLNFAARSDYCANASDIGNNEHFGGPGSYAAGDAGSGFWPPSYTQCTGAMYTAAGVPTGNLTRLCGVSYERSQVRIKDCPDGLSKLYLAGEKYLNYTKYGTGSDAADNEFWDVGYDNDVFKTSEREPASDGQVLNAAGIPQDDPNRYGGAHAQSFHMVMGDGTVHRITFEIDHFIHRKLANRKDALPANIP